MSFLLASAPSNSINEKYRFGNVTSLLQAASPKPREAAGKFLLAVTAYGSK